MSTLNVLINYLNGTFRFILKCGINRSKPTLCVHFSHFLYYYYFGSVCFTPPYKSDNNYTLKT